MVDWNAVWSFDDIALTCFWRSAWMSPRVCSLMTGFSTTPALADATGGVVMGVHARTAAATKSAMSERFTELRIGEAATAPATLGDAECATPVALGALIRGGRDLRGALRGVLRLPLGWRGAEACVVDVLGDRRVRAADRTRRVAAQLDLAERRVERVEQQVAADERLADAEQQLDRLVRLKRSDHARQDAQHAGFRARPRPLCRRRCGEEAAVARPCLGLEHRDLTLEAIDAPVHDGLVPLHGRVVEEIARREVIGAIDDHVVIRDDPVDVLARESLLIGNDGDIGIECLEHLFR